MDRDAHLPVRLRAIILGQSWRNCPIFIFRRGKARDQAGFRVILPPICRGHVARRPSIRLSSICQRKLPEARCGTIAHNKE
jgi:hypothetical protein